MSNSREYSVSAVTYNMGLKAPEEDVVDHFKQELNVGQDGGSDVIVFSMQEARTRQLDGKNLAECVLEDSEYEIVHVNSMWVNTKPMRVLENMTNRSAETSMCIAVKRSVLEAARQEDPKAFTVEDTGKYWNSRSPNKGGVYATLNVGDKKVGVVAVHLDSSNPAYREKETQRLLEHYNKEGHEVDSILIGGDLNERWNKMVTVTADNIQDLANNRCEDVSFPEVGDQWSIENDKRYHNGTKSQITSAEQKGLERAYGPIATKTGNKHLREGYEFAELSESTYGQVAKDGSKLRSREKNTKIDGGNLDNWGVRNFPKKGQEAEPPCMSHVQGGAAVVNPQLEDGEDFSDHKAVICSMSLTVHPRLELSHDDMVKERSLTDATEDYFQEEWSDDGEEDFTARDTLYNDPAQDAPRCAMYCRPDSASLTEEEINEFEQIIAAEAAAARDNKTLQ